MREHGYHLSFSHFLPKFNAILCRDWTCQVDTVVAEMITELFRFEPEICICNGNLLGFKRESVSVLRDSLLKFPQICLCNGN